MSEVYAHDVEHEEVSSNTWVGKARYVLRGFEVAVKQEELIAGTTFPAALQMLLALAIDTLT